MQRQTSIEAYRRLVTEGVLPGVRRRVYEYLYNHGPATITDAREHFNDQTSTYSPRFAELNDMGLIRVVGTEHNVNTGVQNLLWDVTDRVDPLPRPKKTPKRELKKRAGVLIGEIESMAGTLYSAHIDELRSIVDRL